MAEVVGADLEARLSPPLSAIHPRFLESWYPELQGTALRESLLSNPRLKHRILAEMSGFDPECCVEKVAVFEGHARLEHLLETDRLEMIQCLGCAWNGAQIAELITKGQAEIVLPDVSRKTLKRALILRTGEARAPSDLPLPLAISEDGYSCIRSWMTQFPERILHRLSLTESQIVPSAESAFDAAKSDLVERFLNMLAEDD